MIIGILGESGSGKDTVVDFLVETLGGQKLALADPIKQFANTVFDFSEYQLYGPSKARNAFDDRYSFDNCQPDVVFTRTEQAKQWLLHQFKPYKNPHPNDLRRPPPLYTKTEIELHRDQACRRFNNNAILWLYAVLPPGIDLMDAMSKLRETMGQIMAQKNISPRFVLQAFGGFGRDLDPELWLDIGLNKAKNNNNPSYISDCRYLNEVRKISLEGRIIKIIRPSLDTTAVRNSGIANHHSEMEQKNKAKEMEPYISATIFNDGSLDNLRQKTLDFARVHLSI